MQCLRQRLNQHRYTVYQIVKLLLVDFNVHKPYPLRIAGPRKPFLYL